MGYWSPGDSLSLNILLVFVTPILIVIVAIIFIIGRYVVAQNKTEPKTLGAIAAMAIVIGILLSIIVTVAVFLALNAFLYTLLSN